MNRLTANAEAATRLRHMRLHLIADADIPKIGDGRKQTLASHNIYTAADIDEYRIRAIRGFGDSLTNSLLGWRNEVNRQFRFDPKTDISAAEQQAVTVQLRTTQQRILNEASQKLVLLDSLAPTYHAELQRLAAEIKFAASRREQARADLSLLPVN